jgi:hypothetical protein
MPIEGRSLEAISRTFCDQLNRLLAKTISQQPLVMLAGPTGTVNIAFRHAAPDRIVQTARLRTRFGEMELFIGLLCEATKIKPNRFRLFVSEYRYTLTPTGLDDPLWRWEYKRKWPRQTDRWCRHHVQGDIPITISAHTISLNELHLPTGYVALEEIIRFCLTDLRVRPLFTGWHDIIEKSYRRFRLEPFDE